MYVIVYVVSVSVCLYVCVRDAAIWYAIILKHDITIIGLTISILSIITA